MVAEVGGELREGVSSGKGRGMGGVLACKDVCSELPMFELWGNGYAFNIGIRCYLNTVGKWEREGGAVTVGTSRMGTGEIAIAKKNGSVREIGAKVG